MQERHLEGSLSFDWMGIGRSSGLWVWKEGGTPSTGLKNGQDITECLFVQSVQSSLAPEYFQGGALETNPSEEDQVLQYTLHCGTICCGQRGVRAAAYTRQHFSDPQQALQTATR